MAIVLRIINRNNDIDERVELPQDGEITFGRAKGNDYVLKDDRASSKHALMEIVKGKISIKDLGSKNGTYIDKRQIDQGDIFYDSQLIMGETKFVIEANHLSPREKARLTKKESAPSGRKESDLTLANESIAFELTNSDMDLQQNKYNSGKGGIELNTKKKRK